MSEEKKIVGDRALVLGPLPGERPTLAVLRQRGEGAPVEAGVVRPAKDGEPIHGELVALKPVTEGARLCDVEVIHSSREPARADTATAHAGPSRVSNEPYRAGWDRIFGERSTRASN